MDEKSCFKCTGLMSCIEQESKGCGLFELAQPPPPDFSQAKVGQELWSLRYGTAHVISVHRTPSKHAICCEVIGKREITWMLDGVPPGEGFPFQDLYWSKPLIIETGGPGEVEKTCATCRTDYDYRSDECFTCAANNNKRNWRKEKPKTKTVEVKDE